VDNLSARQLRAQAEIKLADNRRYGGIGDDIIGHETGPSSESGTSRERHQVNTQSTNKWMEKIKTGKKTYTYMDKRGRF